MTSFGKIVHESAPFIRKFKGSLAVLLLDPEVIETDDLETIADDLVTLRLLGLRLVIVPYFSAASNLAQTEQKGSVTADMMEAQLLAFDHFARQLKRQMTTRSDRSVLQVLTGDWIVARSVEAKEDASSFSTSASLEGRIRAIDCDAIGRLSEDAIVLLSLCAPANTGSMLVLNFEEVVQEIALQLNADRLVAICGNWSWQGKDSIVNVVEAKNSFQGSPSASAAVMASKAGVKRVHLLPNKKYALLEEVYSRTGSGVMVLDSTWETLRKANLSDTIGIAEMLRPLENDGTLVRRTLQDFERDYSCFWVIERDSIIIGSAALLPIDADSGELAAFAVNDAFRGQKKGEELLQGVIKEAKTLGYKQLYTLTTKTENWFMEHGFRQISAQSLPLSRFKSYNETRKPHVLVRSI